MPSPLDVDPPEEIVRAHGYVARLGDRSLFPDLEARAYLSHAAVSPPSIAVSAAVQTAVSDYGRRGLGAFGTWYAGRQRLRAKLAAMIGAEPDELGFVANTTAGVSAIALCAPWTPGDRIVIYRGEFPTNVTPWQRAAALHDLRLCELEVADFARDDGSAGLSRLRQTLAEGARMVAVSAVQFQTGLRMPLRQIAELCHDRGAELFVDAMQACGGTPLDVKSADIDYLSCGSHKWLMGLEGAAFIYVRRGLAAALRPHVAGWMSHVDGFGFLFEGPDRLRYDREIRPRADFVEAGAQNAVGFAGLEAAVDLIGQLGVAPIFEHVQRYLDALEAGLCARGFTSLRAPDRARRSCILGVTPPEGIDVLAVARDLGAAGIACTPPDGVLRFAPHWPNDLDEVDAVLAAVDEACPG